MLAILSDKVHFTANFIPVSVVDPKKDVCNDSECHPSELQILLDGLNSDLLVLFLDYR